MLAAFKTDVVTGPCKLFIFKSFYLIDSNTSILFSGLDSSSLLLATSNFDEEPTSSRYVKG